MTLRPECVQMMAEADFESVPTLAAALGLRRCIHGLTFPCAQCNANRRWNEAATGRVLTAREFENRYVEYEEACNED